MLLSLIRGGVAYGVAGVLAGAFVMIIGSLPDADEALRGLAGVDALVMVPLAFVMVGILTLIPFLVLYGLLNWASMFNVWTATFSGALFVPLLSFFSRFARNGQADWSVLTGMFSMQGLFILVLGAALGWLVWRLDEFLLYKGLGG